ncbi:MAG: hypothetical protein HND46_05595 [Chloroflexi bacterium]|nr:hypothetical protein [Chloroflexota bacterium]
MNQTGLINLIQINIDADRLTAQIERALGKDYAVNAESEDAFATANYE